MDACIDFHWPVRAEYNYIQLFIIGCFTLLSAVHNIMFAETWRPRFTFAFLCCIVLKM